MLKNVTKSLNLLYVSLPCPVCQGPNKAPNKTHTSPLGYTCSWQGLRTSDPSYVEGYLNWPPPANSCVCLYACIHPNTKRDRWREKKRSCVCLHAYTWLNAVCVCTFFSMEDSRSLRTASLVTRFSSSWSPPWFTDWLREKKNNTQLELMLAV